MVELMKGLVGSFGASFCFAFLFNAPRRCVVSSSLVGMAGYGVYMAFMSLVNMPVGANFAGALAVAVLAEMLAKKQKAPAIIFDIVGVIPLVPGAGLYRTMLALVLERYSDAIEIGVETMLISGSIAMAIAMVTLFSRAFRGRKLRKNA